MRQVRAEQTEDQTLFSAALAHEARTPLANIRLYIELIKWKAISVQSHYCSVVDEEIARLSLLVDNAILLANPNSSVFVPLDGQKK